jgi:hypothetical protein
MENKRGFMLVHHERVSGSYRFGGEADHWGEIEDNPPGGGGDGSLRSTRRDLALNDKYGGAGDGISMLVDRIRGRLCVGSGHDNDRVLTIGINRDKCNSGGSFRGNDPGDINPCCPQSFRRHCRIGVFSYRSNERSR